MPKKIINAFSPWYDTVTENNAIFNATVCILGILILSIHTVNLIVKKGKRKDEQSLLNFFVFTIVHFATYLVFTLVKVAYTTITMTTCILLSFVRKTHKKDLSRFD